MGDPKDADLASDTPRFQDRAHAGQLLAGELRAYAGRDDVVVRISHYFHARLESQFDMVLHIDETSAVDPLEMTSEWEAGAVPETYPWGV